MIIYFYVVCDQNGYEVSSMMNISKFFSKLITGLVIIGLTSIGLATQEEGKQSGVKEAIKSKSIEA